jgi:hypothetical protein
MNLSHYYFEALMTNKSIPLSVRISHEDAEFIAGLEIEGAKTPSDKVRAIITNARQRQQQGDSYTQSLSTNQEMLAPALQRCKELEHRHQMHSELPGRLLDWLPETSAFLATALHTPDKEGKKALQELEAGLIRRTVTLMQSVLLLAITRKCPCYDDALMDKHLQPVLDIAQMIMNNRPHN